MSSTPAGRLQPDQALCDAAAEGDLRRVKRLLLSGVHPDSMDEDGTTALMAATFAAHAAVVRTLLAAGADPNVQDVSGLTALMNAAIADGEMDLDGANPVFVEIVEALLEAGADPESEDQDGMTVADHAAAYELHELLGLLERARPEAPRRI